jgi:hypothetical protein
MVATTFWAWRSLRICDEGQNMIGSGGCWAALRLISRRVRNGAPH